MNQRELQTCWSLREEGQAPEMTERISGMLKRAEGHPIMRKVENDSEKWK